MMKKLALLFLFCALCAAGASAEMLSEPALLLKAKSSTGVFWMDTIITNPTDT